MLKLFTVVWAGLANKPNDRCFLTSLQGLVLPLSFIRSPKSSWSLSLLHPTHHHRNCPYKILLEVGAEMPTGYEDGMSACCDVPSPLCREIY